MSRSGYNRTQDDRQGTSHLPLLLQVCLAAWCGAGCIVIERVPVEGEVPLEAMAGQSAAPATKTAPSALAAPDNQGAAASSALEPPARPVSPWANELSQEEMQSSAAASSAPVPPSSVGASPPGAGQGDPSSTPGGMAADRGQLPEPPANPDAPAAPSFGQGAELYRAEPGENLPPPPQARAEPLRPGLQARPGQPATSAAEQLARTLELDVEDLKVVTLSRRIAPRTQIRIDGLSTRGRDLRMLTAGDPRLEPLAFAIEGHLASLQICARQHDRVGMMEALNNLTNRLRELQAILAART